MLQDVILYKIGPTYCFPLQQQRPQKMSKQRRGQAFQGIVQTKLKTKSFHMSDDRIIQNDDWNENWGINPYDSTEKAGKGWLQRKNLRPLRDRPIQHYHPS
jgi:hypothetical protein